MKIHLRAAVAVLTAAIGMLAVVAPAQAQTSEAICYSNHCWNNWNGRTGNGNLIKFYSYNRGTVINNGWQVKFVGYVTNQGPVWPFVDGSGQNNRYNGAPVYQFKWNQDQAVCAGQQLYSTVDHEGPLATAQCFISADKYAYPASQLFVYSASRYLVPVDATNREFRAGDPSYVPTFVGNEGGDNSNGAYIWINDNTYLQWTIQQNA